MKTKHVKTDRLALLASQRFSAFSLGALVLALTLIGYFVVTYSLASTTTMYLAPASGSMALGANLNVAVRLNTSDSIRTVRAVLTYPSDKFDYVSINAAGSAFTNDGGSSGGSGNVTITRTIPSGSATGDVLIATVTLKSKSIGTAALAFANGTLALRASDNANVLGGTSGGSYTISSGVSPPVVPPTPPPAVPPSTPPVVPPTVQPTSPAPSPSSASTPKTVAGSQKSTQSDATLSDPTLLPYDPFEPQNDNVLPLTNGDPTVSSSNNSADANPAKAKKSTNSGLVLVFIGLGFALVVVGGLLVVRWWLMRRQRGNLKRALGTSSTPPPRPLATAGAPVLISSSSLAAKTTKPQFASQPVPAPVAAGPKPSEPGTPRPFNNPTGPVNPVKPVSNPAAVPTPPQAAVPKQQPTTIKPPISTPPAPVTQVAMPSKPAPQAPVTPAPNQIASTPPVVPNTTTPPVTGDPKEWNI